MSKMHYVFVYGTLRKGEGNNLLLKDADFLGETSVSGFQLVGKGASFPYVVPASDNDVVHGELYGVDYDELKHLDYLEGFTEEGYWFNHYERVDIRVNIPRLEHTPVWIYVVSPRTYEGGVNKMEVIESGDWLNQDGPREDS